MRAFAFLTFLSALAAALLSLACVSPVEDDTTLVAAFAVVGSIDENTCGAQAVTLPDPWNRPAELRHGDVDAYFWREVSTGVLVQGTRTAGGEYRFRGTSERELLPADPSLDYPGCRVRFDDDLRFTLEGEAGGAGDGGADAGVAYSLEGRQTTVVSIVAGSNCAPALNANGGTFLALPCEFSYDLEGTSED